MCQQVIIARRRKYYCQNWFLINCYIPEKLKQSYQGDIIIKRVNIMYVSMYIICINITVKTNLKIANFLDIHLDLVKEIYQT